MGIAPKMTPQEKLVMLIDFITTKLLEFQRFEEQASH